ncbi:nose resistant to fluoxetine protein 6 [Lingula anatina]|uniref:Nose resistant to fluoxetine protein 6 n=1 Tax=Lingula anatina TaxID=7574 RepID=A0A1S3J0W7_LINAN|nr:nose resistant to fluoxetine protein 6 [Lingula anatina]|eukprot:XP_013404080.1 nose resistant to fluoxetine protein 6 [Lingula anatina]
MGKPEAGLMYGNTKWHGQFEQCMRVKGEIKDASIGISLTADRQINGEYCKIYIPLPAEMIPAGNVGGLGAGVNLEWGVCLPNTCTSKDVTIMSQILGNSTYAVCEKDKELVLSEDPKAIACIALLTVFAVLIVFGTLMEGFGLDKTFTPAAPHEVKVTEEVKALEGVTNPTYEPDVQPMDTYLNHYVKYQPDDEKPTTTLDSMKEKGVEMNGSNGIANGHKPVLDEKSFGVVMPPNWTFKKAEQKQTKSTSDDHKQEKKPEPPALVRLFAAFSLYTTLPRLLSTHQGSAAITCLNGIRVMSIGWVVLGHTYGFAAGFTDNIMFAFLEMKRFSFTAVSNAYFSVDTFFLLSGVLVAYLFLRQLHRENGVKTRTMVMYYVHRYIRLSPLYFMVLFIYVALQNYMGRGPMSARSIYDQQFCEWNWWTNLIYVNNVVKNKELCFGLSWYIANDFQFYILAPLFLLPLYWKPVVGILLIILAMGAYAVGATFTLLGIENPRIMSNPNFLTDFYILPWCRIGPYLVGLVVGFILYKTDRKIKFNKVLAGVLWIVSLALVTLIIFIRHDETENGQWGKTETIAYEVVSKPLWAVAVGWIIIACATGYGGFINSFLSWSAWVPLSRMTYAVYLVHPTIMWAYQTSLISELTVSDFTMSVLFTAYLVLSYVAALVVSLAFEVPILGLEKILLKK